MTPYMAKKQAVLPALRVSLDDQRSGFDEFDCFEPVVKDQNEVSTVALATQLMALRQGLAVHGIRHQAWQYCF